jgi:hypothetical protein
MSAQIEIIFPLTEVDEPTTRAVYVDGLSNAGYAVGPVSGRTFTDASPHQIGMDDLTPPV